MKNSTEYSERIRASKLFTDRFFHYSNNTGKGVYWDSLRGKGNIGLSELVGLLVAYGVSYKIAKNVVDFDKIKLRVVDLNSEWVPNSPAVVNYHGAWRVNSWLPSLFPPSAGISAEQARSDAAPWLEWLHAAMGDASKVEWLLMFLAWRYQNPTAKVHHSVYLFGPQGQGKSLFVEMLTAVFGETNIRTVGKAGDLTDKGSIDNWTRVWLVAEELHHKLGERFYTSLKAFTGTTVMQADRKYEAYDTHKIPAQLIMLSNHAPTFLELDDRRFFVATIDTGLRDAAKNTYFDGFATWAGTDAAKQAVATLLQTMPLGGYSGSAPPPLTPEKATALSFGEDEVVKALRDWAENSPDVWTCTFRAHDELWERYGLNDNAARHKLAAAGWRAERLRVDGKQSRYWVREEVEIIPNGNAPSRLRKDGREQSIEDSLPKIFRLD